MCNLAPISLHLPFKISQNIYTKVEALRKGVERVSVAPPKEKFDTKIFDEFAETLSETDKMLFNHLTSCKEAHVRAGPGIRKVSKFEFSNTHGYILSPFVFQKCVYFTCHCTTVYLSRHPYKKTSRSIGLALCL